MSLKLKKPVTCDYKVGEYFLHGDVVFSMVEKNNKFSEEISLKTDVIEMGTSTGNSHTLVGRGYELKDVDGTRFLDVTGENVVVAHQEHDPILIPIGFYQIGRQREFDHINNVEQLIID